MTDYFFTRKFVAVKLEPYSNLTRAELHTDLVKDYKLTFYN